jgi:hypothetical protein
MESAGNLKELDFTREFAKGRGVWKEKYQFKLAWEGTHYPIEDRPSGNPNLRLIRWMAHLDVNNEVEEWFEVPGQYKRTFIGQSSGTVTWEVSESMDDFYKDDREAALARVQGKDNYKQAIFASDKQFSDMTKYPYPFKSGYYFNPGGTYTCTVETIQYKDEEKPTEEHRELVEAIKAAFCYESNLIYVNSSQNYSTLGEITQAKSRGLLTVKTEPEVQGQLDPDYDRIYARIDEADAHSANPVETHELIKEILEGYKESETEYVYEEYLYREQTNKKIYRITEETVITFTIAVPRGKMYTHVNMANGDYTVVARVGRMEFEFDYAPHNRGKLIMQGFNLDGMSVNVRGSMHDDRM